MSTWHQQQAFRRNGPPQITRPTIVTNPMHGLQTHMTFPTAKQAREVLQDWQDRGVVNSWDHAHVRIPAGWVDPPAAEEVTL